jgi:hypothetical protein
MKPWNEMTHFVALDWPDDHHDSVVVDAGGQVVFELTFTENFSTLPPPRAVAGDILPAIEPGVLAGGMGCGVAERADPGGRMPAATEWQCREAPYGQNGVTTR